MNVLKKRLLLGKIIRMEALLNNCLVGILSNVRGILLHSKIKLFLGRISLNSLFKD